MACSCICCVVAFFCKLLCFHHLPCSMSVLYVDCLTSPPRGNNPCSHHALSISLLSSFSHFPLTLFLSPAIIRPSLSLFYCVVSAPRCASPLLFVKIAAFSQRPSFPHYNVLLLLSIPVLPLSIPLLLLSIPLCLPALLCPPSSSLSHSLSSCFLLIFACSLHHSAPLGPNPPFACHSPAICLSSIHSRPPRPIVSPFSQFISVSCCAQDVPTAQECALCVCCSVRFHAGRWGVSLPHSALRYC